MAPKYDFYQNESKVVINIFLKDANKLPYRLEVQEQQIQLNADPNINLCISLYKPVNHLDYTIQVRSTKIEITLQKLEAIRWPALEQNATKPGGTYAVSKNWNAVAKEGEEYEKKEMNVYQALGLGASEDAKRAMMKSITESNGTVLNMDWNKVGAKYIKPYEEKSSSDTEDSDKEDSDESDVNNGPLTSVR